MVRKKKGDGNHSKVASVKSQIEVPNDFILIPNVLDRQIAGYLKLHQTRCLNLVLEVPFTLELILLKTRRLKDLNEHHLLEN